MDDIRPREEYAVAFTKEAYDNCLDPEERSARTEANAYLIAAAPELLEACQKASRLLGQSDTSDPAQLLIKGILDKAIAKTKVG